MKYRLFICFCLLFLCFGMAGCSDELDPGEPEGAYELFRQAMLKGDVDEIWARCDATTHEYFQARYEKLMGMEKDITRYLPSADHRIARRQSGAVLLGEVKDGKSLFVRVFQIKNVEMKEAYELGMRIEEINLSEDKAFAKVITRGGRAYLLARNSEDEQWYVMLVRSVEAVDKKMNWVESNQSALRQTVDDLIAEERAEREKIIAELMNYK